MPPASRQIMLAEASRVGLALDEHTTSLLERYLDLLSTWGRRMNLVSSPQPEHVITRHLTDAFVLAAELRALALSGDAPDRADQGEAIPWRSPTTGIDVGSGAGLPAVPLGVLIPSLELDLVEPNRRKCAFLRTVRHELSLSWQVHACRLEQLSLAPHDLALSRATWAPEEWLRRAAPLVSQGGWLVTFLAREDPSPTVPDGLHLLRRMPYALADGTPRVLLLHVRCFT